MNENNYFIGIDLLLKNAKINLILANNNLSYIYNNNIDIFYRINNIVNTIKRLEDSIELNIKWIDDESENIASVEKANEIILEKLISSIENVIFKTNENFDNNKNEFLGKANSKINKEVGKIGGSSLSSSGGFNPISYMRQYVNDYCRNTSRNYSSSWSSRMR